MAKKRTIEEIEAAVKTADSMMGFLRNINVKPAGGSHSHWKKRLDAMEIDRSHWLGKGSNKGKTSPMKLLPESILVLLPEGSYKTKTYQLRRALLESGVEYECNHCKLTEWLGDPIVLEIDHINGSWLDNRKQNLQFLCPNCHGQKTTGVWRN